MGEMCPPTAADYAMDAARSAQRATDAFKRRRETDGVRIDELEDRVKALEAAVRGLHAWDM